MNLPSEWMPCLRLMGLLGVEAGLITVACALLQKRSQSAVWHRSVWQMATAGVFAVLVLELSGLSRDLAAWSSAWTRRTGQIQPGEMAVRGSHAPGEEARPAISLEFQRRVAEQFAAKRATAAPATERTSSPARRADRPRIERQAEPFLEGRSTPWPAVIWLIGTGAALGPICIAWLVFGLCYRKRGFSKDEALARRVGFLADRLGFRRRVRVLLSPRLRGPIAFGLARPTIGLPADFTLQFSAAQQDAMLTHELAHLAAHDSAWQRLADVVAAVLWWHPLVWWMRHRLRLTAEHAADEASVVVNDGPGLLAECLVKLASRAATPVPVGWVQATGSGFRSRLGQRIQKLVNLEPRPWSPPSPARVCAMKTLFPAALVAAALLCTAWINPPHEGEPMKTMKQRWNRSLATLALFAAVAAEPGVSGAPTPQAGQPPASTPTISASTLIQDGRLLLEMGSLDAAEQKLQAALKAAPSDPKARYLLDRVQEARLVNAAKPGDLAVPGLTPPGVPREKVPVLGDLPIPGRPSRSESQQLAANSPPDKPAPPAEAEAAEPPPAAEPAPEPETAPNVYRMDPRLLERYGIRQRMPPPSAKTTTPRTSRGKQQIEAKLNQIVLNEISLDNIPISELVRFLNDEARQRDPEKKGINFLIANVLEETAMGVDPTTGMALGPTSVDIGSFSVSLRLRDVRLKDVLDAITRVAEQPVRYSIEDYGVVFSPASGHAAAYGLAIGQRNPEPPFVVRTFRVDTNTFLPGLENAFGIKLGDFSDKPAGAPQVREAMREVLKQLGIEMDPPQKIVAYNYITGIVMVRATSQEMDLIEAAMETLGGIVLRQGPRGRGAGGYGGGFGGVSGPAGGGGMGRTESQGEKQLF